MTRRALFPFITVSALLIAVIPYASASAIGAHKSKTVPIAVAAGKNQLGIDIVWNWTAEPTTSLDSQIQATLNYAKSLGANAVDIDFDLYVSGPTSNVVAAGPTTPPPMDVLTLVEAAKAKHLFVVLRPFIDETNPKLPWRGRLHPSNLSKWFASYDKALAPYAYAARLGAANELSIDAELESLAAEPEWKTVVVPYIRKYYSGLLMVDAAWENPGLDPQAGLTWGINAYRPLGLPASATVAQLTSGWNKWLKWQPLPEPTDETYIMEVGIAAQAKAYTKPSATNWNSPIMPIVQAKWFHAACNFYHDNHFKGIYFYFTNLEGGPQTKAESPIPTALQGASLTEIKNCFEGK